MTGMRRNRAEEEYGEGGRETWSAYEETYRDGSLKNECWNSGKTPSKETDRDKDPEEASGFYD